MRKQFNFLILIILLLLITACPPIEDTRPDGHEGLDAPTGVSAGFFKSDINVTWDSISDAEKYEVYRKDGAGDYVLKAVSRDNSFIDNEINENFAMQL